MNKKVYRWQPELTTSVIYWSCTFIILFTSFILYFESFDPYIISISSLSCFFLFFYLGYNRYFILTNTELVIHHSFFFKNTRLHFQSIEQIKVGDKCIEITSDIFKNRKKIFLMTAKQKKLLLNDLKASPQLATKIIEDRQLKLTND